MPSNASAALVLTGAVSLTLMSCTRKTDVSGSSSSSSSSSAVNATDTGSADSIQGFAYSAPAAGNDPDWMQAEHGILENHVQLTTSREFEKAGESYFSPDGKWIIFQGIAAVPEGQTPDEFYAMYVARVKYDRTGMITGLDKPICISLPHSANTCGWFNPVQPGRVQFGSTVITPVETDAPGYQRKNSRYRWAFPAETDIITMVVPQVLADETGKPVPAGLDLSSTPPFTRLTTRPGYDAEDSLSNDGRFMLYCQVEAAPKLGDLYIKDLETGVDHVIVTADGYDGGPFFSPDDKHICYRSDRHDNDLLQLFVGDLKFDQDGVPVGLTREHQLTNDNNVNWCPYYHPDGRYLVYATSALGHMNYEIFIIDADPGNLSDSRDGKEHYGTNIRRITNATGFDGLPAFSRDGKWMIWTSQRTWQTGGKESSQLWAARFVLDPDDLSEGAGPISLPTSRGASAEVPTH